MSGRVIFMWRSGAPGRARGLASRFLRAEDGGATVEYTVMTGLVVGVTAVLLLSVSAGTTEVAADIGEDLSRRAPVQDVAQATPRDGGGSGWRTWQTDPGGAPAGQGGSGASGGSGGGAAGPAGGPAAPEGDGAADGSAPTERADASSDQGTQTESGDVREARAEATVPPSPAAASSGREGGSGSNGKDNAGKPDDDDDEDVACGLGKGNASSTGNAKSNGRAHRTPASNC